MRYHSRAKSFLDKTEKTKTIDCHHGSRTLDILHVSRYYCIIVTTLIKSVTFIFGSYTEQTIEEHRFIKSSIVAAGPSIQNCITCRCLHFQLINNKEIPKSDPFPQLHYNLTHILCKFHDLNNSILTFQCTSRPQTIQSNPIQLDLAMIVPYNPTQTHVDVHTTHMQIHTSRSKQNETAPADLQNVDV